MRLQDFTYMAARAYIYKAGAHVGSYDNATHNAWYPHPIILTDDDTGELFYAALLTSPSKQRHTIQNLDDSYIRPYIWAYVTLIEIKFIPYDDPDWRDHPNVYDTKQIALFIGLSCGASNYGAFAFTDALSGVDLHYRYGDGSHDFIEVATALAHMQFSLWGYGPNLPMEAKPRERTITYETIP